MENELNAIPHSVRGLVKEYLSSDSGASAVEYSIIAMAMFLAIIPAFLFVSTGISLKLDAIGDYFASFG